jgi:hypothetical protein
MASAVSQLQAARSAPRLWHSSMDTIVPQECVGVYMQAMITSSDVRVTYESQVAMYNRQVAMYESQVAMYESSSSDVRISSSDVRIVK